MTWNPFSAIKESVADERRREAERLARESQRLEWKREREQKDSAILQEFGIRSHIDTPKEAIVTLAKAVIDLRHRLDELERREPK